MSQRALLVIADIGGYTKFMRVHRVNLAHAQYVVAQLLEAVIDSAEPGLKLAKLEGDAAFFYALVPDERTAQKLLTAFSRTVIGIRRAFLQRRLELEADRVCNCDSCMQAGKLNLKFVAHVGDVAFQKVKRFTELAGVDVIYVHRLLKNSVPLTEYALMSEPLHARVDPTFRDASVPVPEELEGLGAVTNYYVNLLDIVEPPTPIVPSLFRRFIAFVKMTWRSIPYFLGVKKSCENFRNMGEVIPSSSSLPASPKAALPGPSAVEKD